MYAFRTSLIFSLAFCITAGAQTIKISKDNRVLSVNATDEAEADPDLADLHVGFVAYGADLPSAYRSGSQISSAVTGAIEKTGVAKPAIQSRTQRVQRLDDEEMKARKGMRYSVSQSWVVTVEPKNAALVLDAAVQAGANDSGQIDWRLKDSVALDTEATKKAMARARATAEALAQASGVKLGLPVYVTNDMSGVIMPMTRMFSEARVSGLQAAPSPLSIESQRVTRTANVRIVYALE